MTYVLCAMERAEYFWRQWDPPRAYGDVWYEVTRLDRLTPHLLEQLDPERIFFTHWSRIVGPEITDRWECINFHCADLPDGRGSSPVQNEILRGKHNTKVTAHRMTQTLDGGDVYMKRPISLLGGAQEIYLRLGATMRDMIHDLVAHSDEYPPTPQQGKVVKFERRRPHQSNLMLDENSERRADIDRLYDFIRMLDMPGYPHAYIDIDGVRYEFTHALRTMDGIEAHVKITEAPRGD